MKERPILFSAAMVNAILAGQKSQTRRTIKPSWSRCLDLDDSEDRAKAVVSCPYGQPGDRLWVKETWRPDLNNDDFTSCVAYRADGANVLIANTAAAADAWMDARRPEEQYPQMLQAKWRSPLFMPRWASRITLDVVSVRIERVQSISTNDAMAEGLHGPLTNPELDKVVSQIGRGPRSAFQELWDSINGKKPGRDWASNPFVWCVEFKRAESKE